MNFFGLQILKMIIRNHASSTAHLIEPQPFISLVSGEKADNQNSKNKIPGSKEDLKQ
ncbi:MAG: hypothetical protein RLZZ207_1189 [Bacteroidota bacterium]